MSQCDEVFAVFGVWVGVGVNVGVIGMNTVGLACSSCCEVWVSVDVCGLWVCNMGCGLALCCGMKVVEAVVVDCGLWLCGLVGLSCGLALSCGLKAVEAVVVD